MNPNPFRVTGQGFHTMYYHCFEGPYQPLYPSQDYFEVQNTLTDLLTAGDDSAIINVINKIKVIATKEPRPVIFAQLHDVVKEKNIQIGVMFLKMFTLSIEGPQVAKVKTAILEAIKALQQDFRKQNATNYQTIKECLFHPTFVPVGKQASEDKSTAADRLETTKKGYFKEGGKSSAKYTKDDLKYKDQPLHKFNMYSEESIDAFERVYPNSAASIRNNREAMRAHVAAGGMINNKFVMDQNPITKQTEFTTRSIDERDGPYCAVWMTMQSLAYNEILNGRINTAEQLVDFVYKKFYDIKDPRFNMFMFNSPLLQTVLEKCVSGVTVFREFLKATSAETAIPKKDKIMEKSSAKDQSLPEKANPDPFKHVDMFLEDTLKPLDQAHPECAWQLRGIRSELVNRAKTGELLKVNVSLKKDTSTQLPNYILEPYQMSKEDDIYPYCLTLQALIYDACIRGEIADSSAMIDFIEKRCTDVSDKRFITYLATFGQDKYGRLVSSALSRFKNYFDGDEGKLEKNIKDLSLNS